jgi:hypothetical protein
VGAGKGFPMTYRLDLSEPPETAFQHIARQVLDDARDHLAPDSTSGLEKGVHAARKDVKRLRALLRLHRGALRNATYRRENHALRDAARELSALRDAHVLVQTVDALADRYAGQVPKRAFTAARRHVAATAGRDAPDPDAALVAARHHLTQVAGPVDVMTLRHAFQNQKSPQLTRT